MATKSIPTPGEEIDSKCLKCKDVTNHTIVAMVEEEIAKVQCNVCKAKHKYRPPKPVKKAKKKPAAPRKKTAAKTAANRLIKTAADNYAKLINGRNLDEAMPYSMTAIFDKDDLVNHPSFGVGYVTATLPPNKIELTFNEGTRIFICQLKSPDSSESGGGTKAKKRKRMPKNAN